MNVIFLPEVFEYLENLIPVLYNSRYFSFEDVAVDYVEELIDDIQTTLPIRLHKTAPKYFDSYGKNMKYAIFPKNKRTTWYVFFTIYRDKDEVIYLVRFISKYHLIAQYL